MGVVYAWMQNCWPHCRCLETEAKNWKQLTSLSHILRSQQIPETHSPRERRERGKEKSEQFIKNVLIRSRRREGLLMLVNSGCYWITMLIVIIWGCWGESTCDFVWDASSSTIAHTLFSRAPLNWSGWGLCTVDVTTLGDRHMLAQSPVKGGCSDAIKGLLR